MGTKKISALPSVAATEASVLPHVTGGATDKATLGSLITTPFPAYARWKTISVPASALKINPATTKPDFSTFLDNVMCYQFDPTTEEGVYFTLELPHTYLLGSDISPDVHVAASDTGAGTIRFGLEYTIALKDHVFPPTQKLYGTISVDNELNKHKMIDINSIAGAALDEVGATLVCRLFRDVANDNYAADVHVLQIVFHYQVDSFGSAGKETK